MEVKIDIEKAKKEADTISPQLAIYHLTAQVKRITDILDKQQESK